MAVYKMRGVTMTKIPFSVAMCVYGKDNPQWFDISVNSVINQTTKPDEIILVVDGPVPDELSQIIKKYEAMGLLIFVALPVPGTGAISGALAATVLDIRLKYALPAIFFGTVIATSITSGALNLLLTLF